MKKWFIFLIIFFSALPVFAQTVDTAWVRRYDGGSIDIDYARGLALDASGNVYVTGYSRVGNIGYATIKYGPDGTQIWVDRYNGTANVDDMACAIGVDGSGNIAVTGTAGLGANPDYLTIKCYTDGSRAWTKSLNAGFDFACDLAVDNSSNICVTGYNAINPTAPLDYLTVKYYPNGDTAWVRRFNGPANGDDSTSAIAVDSSGNVYVTGQYKIASAPPYNLRGFGTVKYNSSGTFVWSRFINPPPNTNDYPYDITVDVSDNIYITGRGNISNFDYQTVKYASDGTLLWQKTYNGPGNASDEAYAVAVDGSGNVYVTGYSIGSGTNRDIATIKYASDGTQLWVQRYDGPGNGADEAYAITLDISGNVYVTGYSFDTGGDWDYITIKYDPDGTQKWEKRYKGPVLADAAYAIAVDDFGNVYVTGESQLDNYDYLTIKYWQNYAPNAFSLVSPLDNTFTSSLVNFDWENAIDQDPWDTVRYDLYVSNSPIFHPDSTLIYDSLLDSDYSDSFEAGTYYWKVKAYDNHAEVWSNQNWSFTIIPDTLVGYWKFDEGSDTTVYDSSGYGNDGALINGPPTWVNSLPLLGKALHFDGINDFVRIDTSETINSPSYTKDITVKGWVKPDSGLLGQPYRVVASHWSDQSGICSHGDQSNAWVLEAHQADGKYHSAIGAGDGTYGNLSSKTPVKEGVWQHVAFTWDGSLITFYFNGIADTSTTYTGNMVTPSCYMQIGRTDQTNYVWKGIIDNFKIYNRTLSPEEIRADFESGFSRGDANADSARTVSDVVYLINYLFKGGPFPQPLPAGDANCDGQVTVSDVVYLINYLFKGGPPPGC